jgi:hypothetical protein
LHDAGSDDLFYGFVLLRTFNFPGETKMKKIYFLFAMMLPTLVFAADPFDGTWKIDLKTVQFSGKPFASELKDGMYSCLTCTPKYTIKADGTDQKVNGQIYFDTEAVKVVDANTVQFSRKLAGKIASTGTSTVSADGKIMNSIFSNMSGSETVSGKSTATRVTPGAAGSHAISGSWKTDTVPEYSEAGSIFVYKVTGDSLQMHWNGQSYDAKFDGTKVLTVNDPGKTWVSLKRPSKDTIVETDSNDGKVTGVTKSTASADGKTIAVSFTNPLNDSSVQYTLVKQP